MIVACAALFVALGGVGYAAATIGSAQIKNNSIRGKDIRNSTITGKDVKNSSLTGSDIKNSSLAGRDVKNNSLTGSDVSESTLGTVPSATNAGNAANANSVSTLVNFPVQKAAAAADLASAPEIPIGSKGPYRFYGKCYLGTETTPRVHATVFIAVASGTHLFDTEAEDSGVLTAATAEDSRKLQDVSAGPDAITAGDGDKDFNATDGSTSITGVLGLAAAKQGAPPAGDGAFGAPGNRCLFGGTVFG